MGRSQCKPVKSGEGWQQYGKDKNCLLDAAEPRAGVGPAKPFCPLQFLARPAIYTPSKPADLAVTGRVHEFR